MKSQIAKQITHWLGVIIIGLAVGLAVQFVRAWTEPTKAPPGGNVGAPINTSGIQQGKAGSLVLNTNQNAVGLTVQGSVGIGTITPNTAAPNAVTTGNVDTNDVYLRSIGLWASDVQKKLRCTRKRSGILHKDAVTYCPAAYPKLFSCSTVDDAAPSTSPTDLSSYCNSDSPTCLANNSAPLNFQRTGLGGDHIYLETVINSAKQEGCWGYDSGHSHADYRMDIMCCNVFDPKVDAPPPGIGW